MPFESVQVLSDGVEVLLAQSVGQRGRVAAGEDPLEVGVGRRVEFGDSILGARQDVFCHRALHVTEKSRISSQLAHHETGAEEPKEETPTPVVPALGIETAEFFRRAASQELVDSMPGMDPRQYLVAKSGEVTLELAGAANACPNELRAGVPEVSSLGFESATAAFVESFPIGAFS